MGVQMTKIDDLRQTRETTIDYYYIDTLLLTTAPLSTIAAH